MVVLYTFINMATITTFLCGMPMDSGQSSKVILLLYVAALNQCSKPLVCHSNENLGQLSQRTIWLSVTTCIIHYLEYRVSIETPEVNAGENLLFKYFTFLIDRMTMCSLCKKESCETSAHLRKLGLSDSGKWPLTYTTSQAPYHSHATHM